MSAIVYLIRFRDQYGRHHAVAQLHNNVDTYRRNIDPTATVQCVDVAALVGPPTHIDNIQRGNADLVPAAYTTLVHTPEPTA